jgi:ATP-dependent DNA ligase
MKYDRFYYIYPPRPKNPIKSEDLQYFENQNQFICQSKLNGSNCVIFMNGEKMMIMNRHGQYMTNVNISRNEVSELFRGELGKWMVLNCEYLNKSKQDENRVVFNHKLVIFDILVYNSDYLVGQTFEQRIKLLDDLYGQKDSEKSYLYSISDDVYRVKSFESGFKSLFDNLTQIDMVEGLVLKRKNAKLEIGNTENNNTKSQLKARKPTKLYKF